MADSFSDPRQTVIADPGVADRLRAAWRRERRFVHLRGLCHVLIAAALLAVSAFLLDWTLDLPPVGRIGLWVIAIVTLLVIGYIAWIRHLRAFRPVHVALQVERLYPQLKSVLVSHVQLTDRAGTAGSPELISALSQQAVEHARALDFRRIVDFRLLRGIAGWCATVVALVAVASWLAPDTFRAFIARMGDPSSRQSYPTRTMLEITTRTHVIAEGDGLTLEARVSGEIPADATLTLWPEGGERETVRLAVGQDAASGLRVVTHPMQEVFRNFAYVFRAGDGVSERRSVSVIPPPQITARVIVTNPSYTNQAPRESESLSLTVLEGAQVRWRLTSARPLAAAELIPEGGKPIPLSVSSDGREISYEQSPTKTLSYSLRWTDREYGFIFAPAARHIIKVTPDQPPRIVLNSPERDEKATVRKKLTVTFGASDDFGISSARLVYAIEGRPGAEGAVVAEQSPTGRTFPNSPREFAAETFRWNVAETIPDLKPGDIIRYTVEVLDNRPGAPGKTRSETRRLSIVTQEDYVKLISEEQSRLLSRIKELHGEETRAVEELRDIRGGEAKPPAKTP